MWWGALLVSVTKTAQVEQTCGRVYAPAHHQPGLRHAVRLRLCLRPGPGNIQRLLSPRLLSYTASYEAASKICQAPRAGGREGLYQRAGRAVRGAGQKTRQTFSNTSA